MYNTYARVCNDESDEDEAAAARLIRETAGGAPRPVTSNVVSSTGAARSRTQQDVQQRRGGGRPESTTVAEPPAVASTSASVGNLIDFGDDVHPPPRPTPSASGKPGKQRGRSQPPPPNQVELVTLQPLDPFDFLADRGGPHPPPAQPHAGTAEGRTPAQPKQHPLDSPSGSEQYGRATAHQAASTSGGGAGPHRPAAAFPAFGSFSDMIRPMAGSFGAGTAGSATAAGSAARHLAPAGGAGPGSGGGGDVQGPHLHRHPHSQSTNGIDDLLLQQRALREAELSTGAGPAPVGPYKAPSVVQTDRSGGDVFDPFGNAGDAAGSHAAAAAASSSSGAAAAADGSPTAREASFDIGSGGGEGYTMNSRALLLYAVPLFKDRLVFLPVASWKEREDPNTVLGKVNAGVANVQYSISSMWHGLKDKGEFSAKIYKAGQAILENMNAEERLMRNIPRKANKLIVHHPAAIPPDEIQDQLTQLTSSFCYKSAGKAAAAGLMLPVAVGLEVIAVPGIGWYTAYQLFKSTHAAAGGSRLNNYLKSDKSNVRVCYAPTTKMDLYLLKARLSPDGVLSSEDVEDLCHDIKEPELLHPLTELRNRQLRKTQTTKADYALLPMSAPDVEEQYGSGPKKKD